MMYLEQAGSQDGIVMQDVTQIISLDDIQTSILDKFNYFYSAKLYDKKHLYNIAFP